MPFARPRTRPAPAYAVAVTRAEVTVRDEPLSRRELDEAALVAAKAFHTDRFFEWLVPGAAARARGLNLFWRSVLRHVGDHGRVLTGRVDGRIAGVAVWLAPDRYPYPVGTQVVQLLEALQALYRTPPAVLNGLRYLLAMDKAHPKESLWYLQLLACDPEHQRRGVGAALLEDVHAACDRAGIAAYLETQKEDNLVYYRRFGFEVTGTLSPVRGGPPLWTMRREPRTAPMAT